MADSPIALSRPKAAVEPPVLPETGLAHLCGPLQIRSDYIDPTLTPIGRKKQPAYSPQSLTLPTLYLQFPLRFPILDAKHALISMSIALLSGFRGFPSPRSHVQSGPE